MATDAKSYLISFLATLKGDKAVVRGLRGMEKAINKTSKQMGLAGKTTKNYSQIMTDLGKRALLTIPVWLLLRTVFMGIIRTVGDVIRSNVQLEEQLARIRTVMHGTASEIDTDMTIIKSVILDTAVKSRLSIEKLAEGFYFLRTANLSSKQALDAFIPAVNLAVGTGNDLAETTRAIAGVFNTMGKSITEATTDAEKFNRIADVLAFTYATQDVQLNELIASYTKLAPFISGLDDSFSDIVTTLGFLNTRLLRSGRAGRLTGRAIIQLSKNAGKLANIFGITFDPDKPLNLIRVMTQLNSKIGQSTKLTEKQSRAIQEVFATRGQTPIKLLLDSFDEWNESLELAGLNAEGFAKKMNDIRMNTISAQAQRMKSIFAVLGNELITGATGTGSFAETLKLLNEAFLSSRNAVKAFGNSLGFVFANLAQVSLMIETIGKHAPEMMLNLNPFTILTNFKKLGGALENIKKQQLELISWDDYIKGVEGAVKGAEEEEKVRENLKESQERLVTGEKIRTGELKKHQETLKNQVKLLKIAGVHEKDIAQFKIDQFDILVDYMTLEERQLENLKLQNGLIEAQAKFRKEMATSLQTGVLNILKVMGATESQILEIKIQQTIAQREIIGDTQTLVNLTKLRQKQQVALLAEKQKELNLATSLYLQYKKADEFERTRLRRLMELRQLSPEELAKRYKAEMFDQRVIDEYFTHFSEEGQQAVGEVIREMFDLDAMTLPGLTVPPIDQLKELLNPDLVNPFWDNWMVQARDRLKDFKQEFARVFSEVGFSGGKVLKERVAIDQNIDLSTKIANIEIVLPENALDNVAEEAGRQLTENLLNNEEFQKKFISKIRKLI